MITDKEHKVALATQDGKHIAEHFRTAPVFLVHTVRRGRSVDVEIRANMHAAAQAAQEGAAECWEVIDESLGDVRVVICSGMGENAYIGLLKRNILPLLTTELSAEKALDEYLRGRLKEQPELVHGFPFSDEEGRELMESSLERKRKGGEK